MSSPSARPLGIKSARHLVELYFGVQMVTGVSESVFAPSAGINTLILGPDPRRIKYELIFANTGVSNDILILGSPATLDTENGNSYSLNEGETIIIERTFFADLDAVTLPLAVRTLNGEINVSVREVYLSPASLEQLES
jgi:hypothetical protein